MKRLLGYLNPITRLGKKEYSILFPFFTTVLSAILLEMYAYFLVKDADAVGLPAIFVFIGLIIYFAFHDGIRGGFYGGAFDC
jgi:hypothetical protein